MHNYLTFCYGKMYNISVIEAMSACTVINLSCPFNRVTTLPYWLNFRRDLFHFLYTPYHLTFFSFSTSNLLSLSLFLCYSFTFLCQHVFIFHVHGASCSQLSFNHSVVSQLFYNSNSDNFSCHPDISLQTLSTLGLFLL